MMIKILVDGPYTDFDSDPKYQPVTRHAGEVVDYIEWYAEGLIKAGMAEPTPLPPGTPGSVQSAAGTIPSAGRRRRGRRA